MKAHCKISTYEMNVHSSDVDNVSFITVTLRCQSVLFTGIYAAMWNLDQMDFMQMQYGYGGYILPPFLQQEKQESLQIEITGAIPNLTGLNCFIFKC